MTDPSVNQSGGVDINGPVNVGGDVVGRDQIVNVSVVLQMKPHEPPPDLAQLRRDYNARGHNLRF